MTLDLIVEQNPSVRFLVHFLCVDVMIEKFIIRQPPKGEKDDYDSENSWISDGLPSSSDQKVELEGPSFEDVPVILIPQLFGIDDWELIEIRAHDWMGKFIIRQPPKGEKDDYDSENSWISDGLPSSSMIANDRATPL